MTAPAVLPLAGRMPFREVSKGRLLQFWQQTTARFGVQVRFGERVTSVDLTF